MRVEPALSTPIGCILSLDQLFHDWSKVYLINSVELILYRSRMHCKILVMMKLACNLYQTCLRRARD